MPKKYFKIGCTVIIVTLIGLPLYNLDQNQVKDYF